MLNKRQTMEKMLSAVLEGNALIVAGVGSGITAKGAAKGGADMLATYNTAAYRIQGLPTALAFLPYDDCNALAFATAPQVLANAGDVPVMLGLGAHDPRRDFHMMIQRAKDMGVAGITNEPFLGMYEGDIRRQMEAAGIGFSREVELIRTAAQMGMVTLAYVFTPEEALQMAGAGADFLGVMVGGITSGGGAGGAETLGLDEAVSIVNSIGESLRQEGKNCMMLVHGGPLNDVESVRTVLAQTAAAGYVTGSTGERIPTEEAVCEKLRCFKSIQRGLSP